MEQGAHELIVRRIVIETLDRNRVLDSRVMGIEGNEIGNAHAHQLFDRVSAVQ